MRGTRSSIRSAALPHRFSAAGASSFWCARRFAELDPLLVGHPSNLDRRAAESTRPLRPTKLESDLSPGPRWAVLRPALPALASPADFALGAPPGVEAFARGRPPERR